MSARPPDGSDQPESVDQVMLAVLSNPGRNAAALTPDEERLLDDWTAGRLGVDEAERAAGLVKRNTLAAEHVLEHRLLDAARQSPSVPQSLGTRVLGARAPSSPKSPAFGDWWRSLGPRRWIGLAGVAALASIAAVAVVPMLQNIIRDGTPVQVAMVTFSDRTPLFESSDIRMRGTGTQQTPAPDQRFRDVEVPTDLLKSLLASAGQSTSAASPAIEAYLPKAASTGKTPVRIVIDSALKEKIEASSGQDRLAVRIYDLNDPRVADIRSNVRDIPVNAPAYLLTLKP